MLTFNSEIIIKNKFNHPVQHSVGSVPTSANGFGRDEKINVRERLTNFGEEIFVKNIVDESARKKKHHMGFNNNQNLARLKSTNSQELERIFKFYFLIYDLVRNKNNESS